MASLLSLLGLPTREQVHSTFIGDFASSQPTKNVSRGSDTYRLGRVLSGAIWTLGAKLLYFVKNALPDTAIGPWLDRWGAVYSFPRLKPVGSTGTAALKVTGTVGVSVPAGSELAHADGTLYQTTTVGAVIGADGTVTVDVAAISTGLATNKGVNEVLTFSLPPANVDADATVVVALTGGLDTEQDAPYAVRLLAHIGDPPEGGAVHDYQEWALSIAGVASVYVWCHRRGTGTVDVAIFGTGTGSTRVCSAAVRTLVDDYIESVRPGNVRDWLLLTTTGVTQDVSMTIDIDTTKYKWDWDDTASTYMITAFDSTAKTITVPTLPSTVIAGMRIQVRGEEARITARVGNVLTLSFENDHDGNVVSWFTFSIITPTEIVRASGDLVKPVKSAILDLFNTLGPARSTYSKTNWTDQLKLSKLFAAATDVDGVDDATITTPAANTSPTADDYSDTVYFLIPGKIEVLQP